MRPSRLLLAATLVILLHGLGVFAQQSSPVILLGHLDNKHGQSTGSPPFAYSSCWGYTDSRGREYALLGVYEGMSIIDITTPTNPREVAFIPGLNSIYREMKTFSHYAYVVSDRAGAGLQIVDLSFLPDSAHLVKTWTYPGFDRAHTISQAGPYLYLNGGNATSVGGIAIVSLADPVNPVKVGEWVEHYVHDCYVRNDTIFAAGIRGEGVSIIDARNKTTPQRIAQITYPNAGTHNVWTTENGMYALTTDEVGATAKNLKIWDIRNLASTTLVAEFTADPNAIIHNVYVRGNFAHIAYYTAGYVVVDISNPARPMPAGSYDTYSGPDGTFAGAWNVYPYFPSGRIILSDIQTGLYVFSFSGSVTSVPDAKATIPGSFHLQQNFPNPFNPTTTITYSLPEQTHVTLKIYTLLGQEITTLVDEIQDAGAKSVRFKAESLPSGVYLYRIQAGPYSATKKTILLK